MLDLDARLLELGRDLERRTYRPRMGRTFRLFDPKPRRIYALPFRDRVAQHYLIDATLAALERQLVDQTYACRPGRGTHRCLARAAAWTRSRRFVLRVDIARFFPSIDHAILRAQLDRVTPPGLRWLRDRFLDAPLPEGAVEPVAFHFPGDQLFTPFERRHGLPIGSLTSQLWANLYLAPIDQLLASHLGLGSFVRYCDDLMVFDDDPGRLRQALCRLRSRASDLRLRLHPDKTRLHRTTDPVAFVGFVLRRRGDAAVIRLRHDNVRRMRRRIAALKVEFAAGGLPIAEVTARICAWLAHASHGHTRALLEREHRAWVFRRDAKGPVPRG